jgi:hypothetical protein
LGAGNIEMLWVVKMTTSEKSKGYPISPIQKPMSENWPLPSSSGITQTFAVTISYSQNLRTSLRGVQTFCVSFSDAQTLQLTVSQAQKEKDSTENTTLWRKAHFLYWINQSVNCSNNLGSANQGNHFDEVIYCSDDALALRWRRLISALTEVTINCALFSPSTMYFSISSTTSCGNLAFSCCDLAFLEPVAITELLTHRCDSVYTKKIIKKVLKCDSIRSKVNTKVNRTINDARQKKQRPEVLATTIEASNQQRKGDLRYGYPTA